MVAISATELWAFGSRFIVYGEQEVWEEKELESQVTDLNDFKVPVGAFHNQFFNTICVQTTSDLKIYSCLDG